MGPAILALIMNECGDIPAGPPADGASEHGLTLRFVWYLLHTFQSLYIYLHAAEALFCHH